MATTGGRVSLARGECNAAALALEGALALRPVTEVEAGPVLADLDRVAAMRTKLRVLTT